MDRSFIIWHFGVLVIFLFHFLFCVQPIHSLFIFLFIIISGSVFVVSLNFSYLGFVLVNVYGGAIVVLFLLVSMLFNKKKVTVVTRS